MAANSGWMQCVWSADADFTAVANTTAESDMLTGGGAFRPTFPALTFDKNEKGKRYRFEANGVFGNTGTPTQIFTLSLGTSTTWASADTNIGVTAAITGQSGVSNKWWHLWAEIVCRQPGFGSNNLTLMCYGQVTSMSGFASPFTYPIEPTTPDTATWTIASLDSAVTYYLGLSMTWSAASASNTITVKDAALYRKN